MPRVKRLKPPPPEWVDWFTADEWRALAEYAVQEGESVEHDGDRDEPCIVLGLMFSEFGVDHGWHLLLEQTCFPMSDDAALPQALAVVNSCRPA